jgi:hypothetical protein
MLTVSLASQTAAAPAIIAEVQPAHVAVLSPPALEVAKVVD